MSYTMHLFEGRLNRGDYTVGSLAFFGVCLLVFLVWLTQIDLSQGMPVITYSNPFFVIVLVSTLIVQFSLVVRRLHDIGMSGWWSLLLLISIINLAFTIYLFAKAGSEGGNQYGAPQSHGGNILKIFGQS